MATVVAVHNYPVLLASLAIHPFFHKEGDGDGVVKKIWVKPQMKIIESIDMIHYYFLLCRL